VNFNVKFNIIFKTTYWCISWWTNKTLIRRKCLCTSHLSIRALCATRLILHKLVLLIIISEHFVTKEKFSLCAVLYSFLSLRLVTSLYLSQSLLLFCSRHCHYVTVCNARFLDCISNCYLLMELLCHITQKTIAIIKVMSNLTQICYTIFFLNSYNKTK